MRGRLRRTRFGIARSWRAARASSGSGGCVECAVTVLQNVMLCRLVMLRSSHCSRDSGCNGAVDPGGSCSLLLKRRGRMDAVRVSGVLLVPNACPHEDVGSKNRHVKCETGDHCRWSWGPSGDTRPSKTDQVSGLPEIGFLVNTVWSWFRERFSDVRNVPFRRWCSGGS